MVEMHHPVLVVEDDGLLADMLGEVLEDAGFLVQTSSNVGDALDVITTREVAVVLTDLNLEGSSGIDLLANLSERSPTIPVILMSAFLDDDTERRALGLGARAVLGKPFRNAEVLAAIRRALEQPERASPAS